MMMMLHTETMEAFRLRFHSNARLFDTVIANNNVDGSDHCYSYEMVSRIPEEC
jgi:hypothetical protein